MAAKPNKDEESLVMLAGFMTKRDIKQIETVTGPLTKMTMPDVVRRGQSFDYVGDLERRRQQAKQIMLEIRETRGMQSKIARAIGVKPQAVHQWETVPPHHCKTVAKITGYPPHILRPDRYNELSH